MALAMLAAFVGGALCTLALLTAVLVLAWQRALSVSGGSPPPRKTRLRTFASLQDEDAVKIGWISIARHPLGRAPDSGALVQLHQEQNATDVDNVTSSATAKHHQSHLATVLKLFSKAKAVKKSLVSLGEVKYQHCYTMLKNGCLFLYSDEQVLECIGVIILSLHHTELYPPGQDDDECYSKNSPILLRKAIVDSQSDSHPQDNEPDSDYYLYFTSAFGAYLFTFICTYTHTHHLPIEKESWFFAMRQSAKSAPKSPLPSLTFLDGIARYFSDMEQDKNANDCAWMNAFIARAFFGIHKETKLQEYVKAKFTRKISRIPMPSILESIVISAVDVGNSAPILSSPHLLSYSPSGEVSAEIDLRYEGGFRIEFSANVVLSLGSAVSNIAQKFSNTDYTLRVPIVLRVQFKRLTGRVRLLIRSPPSNRLWIGFVEKPMIEMHVEPVVSSKQLRVSVLTQFIERQIRDVIDQAMVLPNMDDYCFFPTDTTSSGPGGIFNQNPVIVTALSSNADIQSISSSPTQSTNESIILSSAHTLISHELETGTIVGGNSSSSTLVDKPVYSTADKNSRRLKTLSYAEESPSIRSNTIRTRSTSISTKSSAAPDLTYIPPAISPIADVSSVNVIATSSTNDMLSDATQKPPTTNVTTTSSTTALNTDNLSSLRSRESALSSAMPTAFTSQSDIMASAVNEKMLEKSEFPLTQPLVTTTSATSSASSLSSSFSNLFSRSFRRRISSAATTPESSPKNQRRPFSLRERSSSSSTEKPMTQHHTYQHDPILPPSRRSVISLFQIPNSPAVTSISAPQSPVQFTREPISPTKSSDPLNEDHFNTDLTDIYSRAQS